MSVVWSYPLWRLENYCWNHIIVSIIRVNVGEGDAMINEKHG
jgi:hypothetical protein